MNSRTALFVDGSWTQGRGPEFSSHDPATGEPVWTGHAASEGDVDDACRAARGAFPTWSARAHGEREALLTGFAATLGERVETIAEAICREVGKPKWEACTEVKAMTGKIAISIEAHVKRCGEFRSGAAVTRFRPHGVVAVFGPFNFPGHLPNGHIVPALLAGNTVVFKPSERAPGVAALMTEAWSDAGLPAGCLNLLQGGRETGRALAAHPHADGVFFTGSVRGGVALNRQFAERPDKILALEMGGNNPLVVWCIENIDAAVIATLQSAYLSAGQRCTCARRLIVGTDAESDRLVQRLADAVKKIRVGAWTDEPEPFMGPVISADAARALVDAQEKLVAAGAIVLVPIRHLKENTGLVSPGLIDVTAVGDRPDEEWFGPLLQVIRVPDFDAALVEANNTRFGLAAGLLSDDSLLWERFSREVRAGIVNWNQQLTGASSAAPFGGVGLSGNHRPSAYLAADYCSYPVAGIEIEKLTLPATLPPGLTPLEHD